MNEGRLFLYVSPTVAIPLFFATLVLTALIVHAAILTNTTWFGGYWQGSAAVEMTVAPAAVVVEEAAPMEAAPMEAAPAAPAAQ